MGGTFHLRLVMAAALFAAALVVAWPQAEPPAPAIVATASGDLQIASSQDGQAILDVSNMRPGETAVGTLTLSNKSPGSQKLRLSTTSIDDAPGPKGGVLSQRLALDVDRLTGSTVHEVYGGTLAGMSEVDLGNLPPVGAQDYRFTVTLPEGGPALDDAYNGASVEVGWRWTATSDEKAKDPQPAPPVATTPVEKPREPRATPPAEPARGSDSPRAEPDRTEWEGPAIPAGRPVRMWVGGRRSQRLGRKRTLAMLARCRPACSIEANVRVRVGRRWVALPARRVGGARAQGAPAKLAVRLTAADLRRVRKAFGRRGMTVRLTLRATAPAHEAGQITRVLQIRR